MLGHDSEHARSCQKLEDLRSQADSVKNDNPDDSLHLKESSMGQVQVQRGPNNWHLPLLLG